MATIKDVAELANLSVTTVSRVLNNRGYISEETRKKVYEVMKELNYQPNEIARSLFRRKSNVIGVIIPTVAHPFFAELISYIEYYAYSHNYKILLCNSLLDSKKEKDYIEMLKRKQVDGIIMGSHTLEVNEYLDLNLPIVTFDRYIGGHIPYISSDNYQGGTLATEHLIKKGCKKIANICGNLDLNMLSNKRNDAFIEIAGKSNVECITIETETNVFNIEQYEKLIMNMLYEYPDVDGIFASGDLMAAAAIKVCNKLKKSIPEDIKIVGYDDISFASMASPAITTIGQPKEEMGKLAIEIIDKKINNLEVITENILPVKLIQRETT